MIYNEFSNASYETNTMRVATDLHVEVVELIDEYNKYKKEIILNNKKLRDLLDEKPDDDVKFEDIIRMLRFQYEFTSYLPKMEEQIKELGMLLVKIEAYQKSPDDIKISELISDKKRILINMLTLIPEISLDDIANRNGRENEFQSIFQDLNESSYKLNNKINDKINDKMNQMINSIDNLFCKNCLYENNISYDNYTLESNGKKVYMKYPDGKIVNLNFNIDFEYKKSMEDEVREKFSDINAEIEGYKASYEQANINLQDKNVNILNVFKFTTNDVVNVFKLTTNDVTEQLTLSLAGFKVLDAHAINDAAIKVEPIKPFMPMVPQVN
ncbi:hypothetical protein [Providencia sp. SP181]|uniref:hypothetical protein n=1 Tax=Providencia sp. SP181 TaxID=3136277 RepID=UPI003D2C0E19